MKKFMLLIAMVVAVNISQAQNNKFTGIWYLASIENTNADSSKTLPYGEAPQGMLVFEPTGEYAIQILKASRPQVATNNKNTATIEENKALVLGANSHFGMYVIDEQKHTITYKVSHAFFPNWEGKELTSNYVLTGDILQSFSKNTTNGGASAVVTWKRKQN